MTCENCARHVHDALAALPGVRSARVNLAGSSAEIVADRTLEREEIAAALEEAGYALA